jgi:hypothetical protein
MHPLLKAFDREIDQRFRTQVILCIGLLWTVGGFFLFRGVS